MTRASHTSAHFAFVLTPMLTLALAGCPDTNPSSDAGLRDGEVALYCGGHRLSTATPDETLVVGTGSTALEPWVDGQHVTYQWGFQGGTMIVPSFLAPASIDDTTDETACVVVEITNGGDAFTGFRTLAQTTYATRDSRGLFLAAFFDQLGTADFPAGTPLELDVVIRGTAGASHAHLSLVLDPPGTGLPAECDALPTSGSGCTYVDVPATAVVTTLRTPTAADLEINAQCPAGLDTTHYAEFTVTLDSPYGACGTAPVGAQVLTTGGYLVPDTCFDTLGLSEGSSFPVVVQTQIRGTCSPTILRVPSTESCLATCYGM